MQPPRAILFHKHHTSARTRFLRGPDGVCFPTPLPTLCQLVEGEPPPDVVAHPAVLLKPLAEWLGLPSEALALEREFFNVVETPEGRGPVYLVAFTTIDPPFEAAEARDCRFISLMEARGIKPPELELLRIAYQTVMEG
ncbi:hypothetical protein [Endothiovibrio diazotrophicus]